MGTHKEKEKSPSGSGSSGSESKDKSSDVEEVPRKEPKGDETKNVFREARKRRQQEKRAERSERERREGRSNRSESEPCKRRRGRSPEPRGKAESEAADLRKPSHPKGPPKDRRGTGGKGGKSKSKERCPICWQPVSSHQSGKDQHMWLSAVCLSWQIYAAQKEHKKDWALAQRQARELKEFRMQQSSAAPVLVSAESRAACEKAVSSAAAFVRDSSKSKREERGQSSSSERPEERRPKKSLRRPSPSPSPPRPLKKKEPRRSPSCSSSRPRRRSDRSRRGRQIIINVS